MILMQQEKTKALVESGLLLALATILSMLKIFELPYGGSITLASMLPIVIIAYRRGLKWGIGAAGVYSVLQIFTGMKTVSAFFLPGDSQEIWWRALLIVFLDYIVAYTVIGFAAVFRKKASASEALCLGAVFGLLLRFLTHIVSGLSLIHISIAVGLNHFSPIIAEYEAAAGKVFLNRLGMGSHYYRACLSVSIFFASRISNINLMGMSAEHKIWLNMLS